MLEKTNKPRYKVAFVDDEVELTQLFESLLEQDYDVKVYNDPQVFLNSLDQHKQTEIPFEVLVSDLKMPKMSGVEMIQAAQNKGFYFPSIILSGNLDIASAIKAVNLGVVKLIEKPTAFETLRHSLNETIKRKEAFKHLQDIEWALNQIQRINNKTLDVVKEFLTPQDLSQLQNIPLSPAHEMNFDEFIDFMKNKLKKIRENR